MIPHKFRSPRYAVGAWLVFTAAAIASISALVATHEWFLTSQNAPEVALAAFWLSLGGTLLTAAGFLITFQQLVKVSSGAETARRALEDTRRSLSSLASSGEVERAKLRLSACKDSVARGDASAFQTNLLEARQCLFRISQRNLGQFKIYENEIRSSVKEMADISDSIDQSDTQSVVKLSAWLRPYIDLVDKLEVNLSEVNRDGQ